MLKGFPLFVTCPQCLERNWCAAWPLWWLAAVSVIALELRVWLKEAGVLLISWWQAGQDEGCCTDGWLLYWLQGAAASYTEAFFFFSFPEAVMDMQTPSCCLHAANKLSQFIQSCPAQPVFLAIYTDLPMGLAGAVLCWEPVQEALTLLGHLNVFLMTPVALRSCMAL